MSVQTDSLRFTYSKLSWIRRDSLLLDSFTFTFTISRTVWLDLLNCIADDVHVNSVIVTWCRTSILSVLGMVFLRVRTYCVLNELNVSGDIVAMAK